MKKTYFFLSLLMLIGMSLQSVAQTNPGTANLKHQWTFDHGVVDVVGGLTGTLEGAATVANKALNTTAGGFFSMPAAQIGINTYAAATIELWFTPSAGVNTGFTMLSYFGNTTGTIGTDYFFISTARGDNVSRAAISTLNTTNPWATETGVNGTEYDDGRLRHMVATVTDQTISFFIDGVNIGSATLSANNRLQNINTTFAYLARAGYTADPTWRGNIHKFSIYNRALNDSEVLFLFQEGPEAEEVLTATLGSIALDTNYPAKIFNVSGVNLGNVINISPPAGILAFPAQLPRTAKDEEVQVIWDGVTPVDGNILLKSGNTEVRIPIKTADDTKCYVPLYDDVINMVQDPGANSLAFFGGWGSRNVVNIVNEPQNVYCGASSISVGSGLGAGSGSLDVVLTGLLKPNTFYRVKAMVKTINGSFQLGVWGWSAGQGDLNNVINTEGEWRVLDFTFTTGATLGNTQGMFWNNWAQTGTIAYIDNWELYETIEPQLSVSKTQGAFDPEYREFNFTVSAANLTQPITITTPAGITSSASTLVANVSSEPVTLLWDGSTPVNGDVTIQSSGISRSITLRSTSQSNLTCFVPLFTDKTNLVNDVFMNDLANFAGWGARGIISIVQYPDSVYCGSHTARIAGTGSIDVNLMGLLKPNTSYITRAMIRTFGGTFQIGVFGVNAASTAEIQDTINTDGVWKPLTLTFATGETLGSSQGMFINNYQRSGRRAFIDNWELYELGAVSVQNPAQSLYRVFVQGSRIVAEFELTHASEVEMSVFSLQGTLISRKSLQAQSGLNRHHLDTMLPSGVYLVRLSSQGKEFVTKVVK